MNGFRASVSYQPNKHSPHELTGYSTVTNDMIIYSNEFVNTIMAKHGITYQMYILSCISAIILPGVYYIWAKYGQQINSKKLI